MKHFIRYSLSPLAVLPLLGMSVNTWADNPPTVNTSSTTVNISATVVDNTCEVDAAIPWSLGDIKVSDIMDNTPGAEKPVTIALKHCGEGVSGIEVSPADGSVGEQGHIANKANATNNANVSNVMAEILAGDNAKEPSKVLTSATPVKFISPSNALKFNVKLLPPSGAKPAAGEFTASVALKLSYD